MAVKISKGAIVPAKRQMTIEWDGDTTDLNEYTFNGVTMYLVCDEMLRNIEALRGAVIYLSDGSVEIIDDKKFSAIYIDAQKLGTEFSLAGNDLIRASLRGVDYRYDNGSTFNGGIMFANDGTCYVQKLVLPNAWDQFPVGKSVLEEPWCIDYDAPDEQHSPKWLDATGQSRRLVAGRTYRVTINGKTYIAEARDAGLSVRLTAGTLSVVCRTSKPLTIYNSEKGDYRVSIIELIESAPSVADAAGASPTAEEFNALLAALRDTGIIAN